MTTTYDTQIARNYEDVKRFLSGHRPFDHSSMNARHTAYTSYQGWLNDTDHEALRADIAANRANGYSTYVVFSYHTPIAWVRPDGTVFVTDQKFSTTTAKHQTYARGYLK